MNVQASTIMWILDYLTNRPQFVKVQSECKSCSHQQPPAAEQNRGPFCCHFCFPCIWQNVEALMMTV